MITAVGCSHKRYDNILDSADAVLDMYPDSALSLLAAIDPSSIRDKEEKARHDLLLSLATLKVDYASEDVAGRVDSIFRPAFEYYKDKSKPSRESMLAHFTEAYLQDSALVKLKEYDRAIELAHRLGDYNYEVLGYLNKALVYHLAFSSDDELECIAEAQKLLPYVTIPYIRTFAAESAGNAHLGNVDTKNSEKYFNEMLTLAQKTQDSTYIFQAHKNLASVYSVQGRYKESMEMLQPLLSDTIFTATLQPNEIVYYVETLLYSGFKEDAKKLIAFLRDYQDASEGLCYYSALSKLYSYDGAYKKLHEINDSLIMCHNNLVMEKLRFSLLHQEKEYDKKLAEINRLAYQRKSVIIFLSLLSVTLVLTVLLLYHRLRMRNMEKNILIKEEENRELTTQLNELNNRATHLEYDLKIHEDKLKCSESQLAYIRGEKEAFEREVRSKSTDIEQLTKKLETEKAAYGDLEKRLTNDLNEQRQKIVTLQREKGENLLAMTRTEARLLNNWLNTPIQKNEKKTEVIIEKYKDKSLLQSIEKTLNDSTGGIMDFLHLTLQLKPEWVEQVILDLCGFNYISTGKIMDITPSNASARKTRIKHKLLEVNDTEKRKWLAGHISMLR